MFCLWYFLCILPAFAGPTNKGHTKKTADALIMSHADAQCAYRLMEAMCPYPDETISRSAPHAWELCAALGRATSLSSACVFTHMLILISLTLNALQTRYGGILGKFPNLLMLQHGAPGEGKSIALWLVFQILYYFDDTRTKLKLKEWNTSKEQHRLAVRAGEQEEKDAPAKPEHADSVHNKGTFLGMGATLEKQDGRGYLGLHEGRSWLSDAADNKPGGGFEDLNQIMDHDLYKNNPASGTKFYVKNPHLVGSILLHLPELVKQSTLPDSVAGLSRFLVAHFKAVTHKILPNKSADELRQMLTEDPDYFNDLAYDDVVKAI
ncbi:unnamed protein product [Symbiodinium sp. CCMP2592]|nr:unnamed protein product [Symbiodinium sp. CCMP2592]